ncbi:MAG TPA: class I poly(R)-hydroxyalkanoic acid synthase, partial [Phenylobacterium sp.]|nr:class I poly(R)-hydroxyalkanoic acid synthase [Phenylobacterium sp.]
MADDAKGPPKEPKDPAVPPASPASDPAHHLHFEFTPEQREQLEKLSLNLARAALTAQGAIAEAALRQADRPAALSPDPFHVAPALTEVMGRLSAQPDRLMRAQAELFNQYMDLWQAAARRAAGESPDPVAAPAKGDKRFADPDWSDNPVFDVIKQSYLLSSNWMNALVSDIEGVDPMTRRRVEFFMKMLTDAFSPSNFLMTNPAALKAMQESGGESLAKGMENFAADLARGGGQLSISQTDYEQFEIG